MGKFLLSLLVVFIATVGFWGFASEYQKDKVKALFDSSTERNCFEFQKHKLKDSETSYLIDNKKIRHSNLLTKADASGLKVIKAEAKAKNGYGAYGSVIFECVVKGKNVDEKETEYRELRIEINDLLGH